ncbi:ABC transporter permease [Glaciibacter superstes]|uniref:ABC transporter permease n=1 Tax=Glaciibacter superstes TaxID=501023 RepID=UPI0003B7993C|nr:ABC transporter permease [Glaciibacter superstes]
MRQAVTLSARRARRDLGLVVVSVLLIGFLTLLAAALPHLLQDTLDDGAREAVAAAGPQADIVVTTTVGTPNASTPVATPEQVIQLAGELKGRMPQGPDGTGGLAEALGDPTVTILSQETQATTPGADPALAGTRLSIQVGMLTSAQLHGLTLVDGALPADAAGEREVVLSSAAAEAASVGVGSVLSVPQAVEPGTSTPKTTDLTVVGIVQPAADALAAGVVVEDAREWLDMPRMWAPSDHSTSVAGTSAGIVVLTSPLGMELLGAVTTDPSDATIRLPFVPDVFTAALEARVADDVRALDLGSDELAGDFTAPLGVRSGFADALADFPGQAKAAIAQMSLMIAGVLGVAVTVIVLLSRLLVLRRTGDVSLERARGASLVSIGMRTLVESILVSLVGGGIGVTAAAVFIPGMEYDLLSIAAVLLVAALTPVLQTLVVARGSWSASRSPANASARSGIARVALARRLAGEVTMLVLAAGALFAVRSRGLLGTRTDGVDPLLAAAPLLLALAVALILVRVYPLVVRLVTPFARRTRGALGLLGAVQAERGLAVLPLLALTLAVALAVGGGLLVDTVRSGQVDASWQSVGADARVTASATAPLTETDVAAVAAEPGVTAAGSMQARGAFNSAASISPASSAGSSPVFVTVLAVDRNYADVVDELRDEPGGGPGSDVTDLRELAAASVPEPSGEEDSLPVLVDERLTERLDSSELVMSYGGHNLKLRVTGTVDAVPGYLDGPFVYADLDSLSAVSTVPLVPDTLLVMGPGAAAAVESLGVTEDDVILRTAWVDDQQGDALVAGVHRMMVLSVGAVSLLAIIALIASVLASAGARARSLSLLRTLGLRVRLGWWLAFAETAPMVLAALLGGILAGVGMVVILGPSLGLGTLAGGRAPDPVVSPVVILSVIAGAVLVLLITMVVEVAGHRRDRLSEVLRVGETI